MYSSPGPGYQTYFREGIDGTVMTYQKGAEVQNYFNGQIQGGRPGYSFYSQVVEAAGMAAVVDEILIIGYGTGSITEAVLKMPEVKKVTVVEINQTLMDNLREMELFRSLLSDPRLEIVMDDGRRFLLRHKGKFDLILMSPLRTTTAYSNNIYSRQFFELIAEHLNPQGILMAWTDEFNIMSKTLTSVFPDVRLYIWKPEGFYLASPTQMNHKNFKRSVALVKRFPPEIQDQIVSTIINRKVITQSQLSKAVKNVSANQDWKPNIEYYLRLGWQKDIRHQTND